MSNYNRDFLESFETVKPPSGTNRNWESLVRDIKGTKDSNRCRRRGQRSFPENVVL